MSIITILAIWFAMSVPTSFLVAAMLHRANLGYLPVKVTSSRQL